MKLPEIQRSRAQQAQSMSPAQAAAPHLAKIRLGEQVASMINNVLEVKDEQQLSNANSDYRDLVQSYNNWYDQQKTFTPEAIETMGLEDSVDTSEGDVPAWKVRTVALEKFTSDVQKQLGGMISSNSKREAWISDTKAMTAPSIERSIQESANMGIQEMVNDAIDRYEDAKDSGNYLGAAQALSSMPVHTPKLEREHNKLERELEGLQYGSKVQSELDSAISDAVRDGDYSDLEMMAIESEDDDNIVNTPWNDVEHTAWAKTIRAASKAAQIQEKARFSAESGALSNDLLVGIIGGTVSSISPEQRAKLTNSDFRYLINQMDTEDTNVKSDQLTLAVITQSILQIQTGDYSETLSYSEQVDAVREEVKNSTIVIDPITGEKRVEITSSDSLKLFNELDQLAAMPFNSDSQFAIVSKEVSHRILGYADNDMFAGSGLGAATPDSANLNQEAQRSLRKFVDNNGGTEADVSEWREKRMPYFLMKNSKLSFFRMPRTIRVSAVTDVDGLVNYKDTSAALVVVLNQAMNATKPDDRAIEESRLNIQTFDAWATGVGRDYVNH